MKGDEDGYTLLELVLVLFLMSILLGAVVPHFDSGAGYIKSQVNSANIEKIEGAARIYRLDVGAFPQNVSDLVNLPEGVSGWRGPYLKELPQNPYNPELRYHIDAIGRVQ